MIFVGTDLVEIKRIKKSMKNQRFLTKILSDEEYNELKEKNFPPQSVAANFCAKEAFLKLIGKGLGDIDLKNIKLLRKDTGQPYLKLENVDLSTFNSEFSVSITHTKEYAMAVIIAESEKCK